MPTRWRARIWFGVTRTRCRVVPTRSRVVVLPVGPRPTSVCGKATGPVFLHQWFVWMTCWCWGSRSCRWFHTRVPTLLERLAKYVLGAGVAMVLGLSHCQREDFPHLRFMVVHETVQLGRGVSCVRVVIGVFLVHGCCPPASITQKRPNHGQVSVYGEPKFIEGQQPYVQ